MKGIQAPSSCEQSCFLHGDDALGVLFVCAKTPAGSGPPKEAVGEAYGDMRVEGREKAQYGKKNAFNSQARWL